MVKSHLAKTVFESLNEIGFKLQIHPHQITPLLSFVKQDLLDNKAVNHIRVQLPVKTLSSLIGYSSEVLQTNFSVKSDELISYCEIKENGSIGEPIIIFNIKKSPFIQKVLRNVEIPRKKEKKTLVIEYSSPNIAKPFHMGHLRSSVFGNFVANVKELSNKVIRLNYLGDWGTQVGYVRVGMKKLGYKMSDLQEDPVKKMYTAYVLANENQDLLACARSTFAKLESAEDKDGLQEWEAIRQITLEHLAHVYKDLGIDFDEYWFESMFRRENIEDIIQRLKDKELLLEQNDQMNVIIEGKTTPLLRSDGSSLYLSRDIAAAFERYNKFSSDILLYVVDKSQAEHLQTLKLVVDQLLNKDVVHHIPFGLVLGMSSRKGTGIFLSDILEKAMNVMKKQQLSSPNTRTFAPEVTKILAITALKVYILKQGRLKNFKFDWNHALQMTGDTGVKLQYTHCRLNSLEENCGVTLPKSCEPSLITEPLAIQLVVEISRFTEVLDLCENQLESHYLVKYLLTISNIVSRCLKTLPVKGQCKDLAEQRLLLFHTARQVLFSGMKILGVQPLFQM